MALKIYQVRLHVVLNVAVAAESEKQAHDIFSRAADDLLDEDEGNPGHAVDASGTTYDGQGYSAFGDIKAVEISGSEPLPPGHDPRDYASIVVAPSGEERP